MATNKAIKHTMTAIVCNQFIKPYCVCSDDCWPFLSIFISWDTFLVCWCLIGPNGVNNVICVLASFRTNKDIVARLEADIWRFLCVNQGKMKIVVYLYFDLDIHALNILLQ